jgi:hypothetical protein
MNGTKGWGEDGIVVELINIVTTTYEPATTKVDVDGQEQLPRYYVKELVSLGIFKRYMNKR